jgi:Protein of unknown function (DUF2877)
VPSPSVLSLPAAADGLLAPLLAGRPRAGVVVAATPLAVYARLEDASVVGVLDPRAVRVPGSVVVARPKPAAQLVGDGIILGGGAVEVGGVRLVPRRWWDSRVPRVGRPGAPPAAAPLPDAVPPVASRLEPALSRGDDLTGVVDALVGLGPGLTPAGDDVLAGALVALAAAGDHDRGRRLAAAVGLRRHRTTAVSGALLDHAASGRAIPELARYVVALARGSGGTRVVQDLKRVGASSGAALAAGARIGLRVAATVGDHGISQEKAAEVA